MNNYLLLASLFLNIACVSKNTEKNSDCRQTYLTYISKASGNFDIYRNDLAGNETRLTTNPSWDWSPKWNPSLNAIIYYAYMDDTFRIMSMNIDGINLPLDSRNLIEFNLSPDGQRLVMEESRGDNRQLMIVTLADLNELPITDSLAYYGRAKWSPDSKRIAYISDKEENNEVYLYDLESKSTERLTVNTTNEKYLSWGPGSKQLAFTTEYYEEGKPDRNDVFVLDLNTRVVTQITDNPYEDSEIAWSPNGDLIAFHSKRDTIDHIFTMKTDGTEVRQVTTSAAYHGEPEWIVVETSCE